MFNSATYDDDDTSPVPSVDAYTPPVQGVTKEQFGEQLYDTIKTIGGLLGLEQQRAAAIHQGRASAIPALLARRKALQVTLAQQLPRLTHPEMDAILSAYPWVTAC